MPDEKPPFPFQPNTGGRREGRAERRQREKEIERVASRIQSRRAARRHSGAGYPIDQLLREFLDAYNERLFEHRHLPFTFNVLHAFTREEKEDWATFLDLHPERDHAFLIGDFLDYATSIAPGDRGIERLRSLPENVIQNYSPVGDVREFAFIDPSGKQVVIAGFTMTRLGDQLHWLMLGGFVTDLEAETERLREDAQKWEVQSQALRQDGGKPDYARMRAQPLPGTDDVWKTLAYGVFNLRTRSHESRTFAHDHGNMYGMVSDDPGAIGRENVEGMTEEERASIEGFAKRLDEFALIFDMAEAAFLLPSYFAFRIDLVREVQRETAIGKSEVPRNDRQDVFRAPAEMRPGFRKVASLDVVNLAPAAKGTRSYTPPRFSVELEGFWRRLAPDSIGKDPDGRPVQGRTWVRGHMRWRDRPSRRAPVMVKASVMAARERAAEIVLGDGTSEIVGVRA